MVSAPGESDLPFDRQFLNAPAASDLVDLVEWIGGQDAQTTRGPAVGLWTRSTDLDLRDLDRRLQGYDLVRAKLLRATVHLVTRRQFMTWRRAR